MQLDPHPHPNPNPNRTSPTKWERSRRASAEGEGRALRLALAAHGAPETAAHGTPKTAAHRTPEGNTHGTPQAAAQNTPKNAPHGTPETAARANSNTRPPASKPPSPAAPRRPLPPGVRHVLIGLASLAIFAVLLLAAGKDPLRAYADTLVYVFGNVYGFSELFVGMTPLLLTAVAVALPARLGLINVGGEGQLYMGAWLATAGALGFPTLPAWLLLPLMTVLGFAGGAIWAALPGVLRAARLVNETISTLLLNYIAPLIVSFFIFGPWRSSESASYPESPAFVPAARLPTLGGTRINAGLLFGLAALALYSVLMRRTRWGLEMRAIGGNAEASRRLGIPVARHMITAMAVAGGLAGMAGMAEVSAIQGRLVAGLSPGYGFMGFLVAWLAGGSAAGILVMAFLFSVISSVGDILQITQSVPYAVVNLLMAVILFIVLGQRPAGRR